jgi:hypothetical protein
LALLKRALLRFSGWFGMLFLTRLLEPGGTGLKVVGGVDTYS